MRFVEPLLSVLLHLVIVSSALAAPSFTPLGDLSGGTFLSQANGISADGHIVVGESQGSNGLHAVLWEDGVLRDLGLGRLTATSQDGTVVVGRADSSTNSNAAKWRRTTGTFGNVFFSGSILNSSLTSNEATGVSADGSVVVGTERSLISPGFHANRAFKWTAGGSGGTLTYLTGGLQQSAAATGVSSDGSVIVGYGGGNSDSSTFPSRNAVKWIQSNTAQDAIFPILEWDTRFNAVSPNGQVFLGTFNDDLTTFPGYSYGFANSIQVTPHFPIVSPGPKPADALASSIDGAVVVGRFVDDAFIWDGAHGYQSLDQVVQTLGLLPAGWHLLSATGITPDGLTITGYGTNPLGDTQAWVVNLPEPSTALMILTASVGLGWRRRPCR